MDGCLVRYFSETRYYLQINIMACSKKILTGLSPPVKYFTDRSKAVLLLWIFYVFVLSCVCYVCARLFICALWSPAGKGLTFWLSFVVSSVSLSLSHWYPGSGVVLDCIDS